MVELDFELLLVVRGKADPPADQLANSALRFARIFSTCRDTKKNVIGKVGRDLLRVFRAINCSGRIGRRLN